MRERPIKDLLEAYENQNVSITYEEKEGHFPFIVTTGEKIFNGGVIKLKSSISSQYVTSLLLISPYAEEKVKLVLVDVEENILPVSYQYILMTLNMMKIFGLEVTYDKNKLNKFEIPINSYKSPVKIKLIYI